MEWNTGDTFNPESAVRQGQVPCSSASPQNSQVLPKKFLSSSVKTQMFQRKGSYQLFSTMSLARVLQFLDIVGVEDSLQWLHMRLEHRRIQLRETHFGDPPNISVGMVVAYVDMRKQRIFSLYALVGLIFRSYDKQSRQML